MNATRIAVAAVLAALAAAPAFSAPVKAKHPQVAISSDTLKQILLNNPDLVLDVLRNNRKEAFEIISQAAQEERQRQEQEEEAKEKKEMDEAFKNPLVADLDAKAHPHIRGKKDAKYTLVEYADFQCPFCGVHTPNGTPGGYAVGEELRKKYGDTLRFVFKDKPLPMHPQAMPAAKWFEAVALQSPEKAWLFHDKMFENQGKLGDDFYRQTVKDLGLDAAKAQKDAESPAVADKINADIAEAEKLGFSGTPGFLINGVPVRGAYPVETFDSIIQRLDGKQAKN